MVKRGFTLAEVLITLAVIGIVAALTIPALISNYQKKVTVSKLQEAYGIFANAVKMAEVEHGDVSTWTFSEFATRAEGNQYFFDNFLKPYIKVQEVCNPSSIACWKTSISLSGKSGYLVPSSDQFSFTINNGMTAYFWITHPLSNIQIWVNINGKNNKAVLGKDIFGFRLVIDKELSGLPYNGFFILGEDLDTDTLINDEQYGCSKNIDTIYSGRYCGALIKRDGWKIPETYPW